MSRGYPRKTLTFRYLLLSGENMMQESNDVESVLETAKVRLLQGYDVTITIRRDNDEQPDPV